MPENLKSRFQNKLFKQIRIVQIRAHEDGEEWTVRELYQRAIYNAELNEDYELCQALKDSAHKYGLDWQ